MKEEELLEYVHAKIFLPIIAEYLADMVSKTIFQMRLEREAEE